MDRAELADFLRRRRAALTPSDVGLPPGVRRRTPGLRRDEVAALATMSSDYYTRLEQARGPHPSVPLLGALARALRLTDDERDHLFLLAGQAPPVRHHASGSVGSGLLFVLDRLTDVPAFVNDDLNTCIRQNALSIALSGDRVGRSHNVDWFTDPSIRERFPVEDWDRHSRTHVADLRATYGRRRGDADVEAMVAKLLAASSEFAALWDEHEVAVRREDEKRYLHPSVGLVDLLCEKLVRDGSGETLVVLYPRPGTDAREKLDLLAVIGTQDLATRG